MGAIFLAVQFETKFLVEMARRIQAGKRWSDYTRLNPALLQNAIASCMSRFADAMPLIVRI